MIAICTMKWSPLNGEEFRLPSQDIISYTAKHVNILFSSIDRNIDIPYRKICITDDPIGIRDDIEIIPLWDKCRYLGGCYNRLYMFSKDMKEIIGNRFLSIDLDTTIVDNITSLVTRTEDFLIYKLWYPRERYNGSMFMMNAGCRDFIWNEFINNPAKAIESSKHIIGTDQAWIEHKLGMGEAYWDKFEGVRSIKEDFIEANNEILPPNTKIVTWAGKRDPSQERWMHKYIWMNYHYYDDRE